MLKKKGTSTHPVFKPYMFFFFFFRVVKSLAGGLFFGTSREQDVESQTLTVLHISLTLPGWAGGWVFSPKIQSMRK